MSTGIRLVARAVLTSSLLLAPNLLAQVDASAKVETFAEIEMEFEAANKKWIDGYRAALKDKAGNDEIQEIIASRPKGADWAERLMKVIRVKPSSDQAIEGAIWMVRVARVHGAHLGGVLEVLGEHHLDSDRLKDVMLTLGRSPLPSVAGFLGKVHTESASSENQAHACSALGEHLKTKASTIRRLADGDAAVVKRYTDSYGGEALEVLRATDPKAAEQEAAKRFEMVLASETFAAVDHRGSTLGENAKNNLFELRNLAIGKVAPDIIGEDVDGTAMKLSDYRGKVVVIDFWGDW